MKVKRERNGTTTRKRHQFFLCSFGGSVSFNIAALIRFIKSFFILPFDEKRVSKRAAPVVHLWRFSTQVSYSILGRHLWTTRRRMAMFVFESRAERARLFMDVWHRRRASKRQGVPIDVTGRNGSSSSSSKERPVTAGTPVPRD